MQHLPVPPKISSKFFDKGSRIEVRLSNDAVTWYPATFIRLSGDKAYVKFDTSSATDDRTPLRRQYVCTDDVRPAQPPELHRYFMVGEIVEGLCGERRGWRRAEVVGILENSRYSVLFEGAEQEGSEMEQWELRSIRDWVDGSWNPPFLRQQILQKEKKSSSESEAKSNSLKLKVKYSAKSPAMKFSEGMLVEVTSCNEGFQGSWFVAVIVEPLDNNKYLVEYRMLRTVNKTEFLRGEADASCIRYSPPVIRRVLPFEYLDRVDAWYKNGWWEGHIGRVLSGCSYMVHFTYSNEDMVFEHRHLRSHQEWIDGEWFADLKVDPTELNLKPNKAKLKRKNSRSASAAEPIFREGMVVEVKSDEEGYQGSWYTAEIVSSLGTVGFLVEYHTLKTDDESAPLREKALASYIRPCPPEIERIDSYQVLEEVDAWYNEGWWVGLISKVLDDRKYGVYFWTTNEELFFVHSDLRTHQDWIGDNWTTTMRKKSKHLLSNRQVIYIGEHDGMRVEPDFVNGMKVEVKGNEQSNKDLWFPAIIIKSLGRRKYLVQYQTLISDHGTQLYQEAFAPCIRPSPPLVQRKEPFKPFEQVDTWYNNGWRAGQICKAFPNRDYSVHFNTTNEILEFQHFELRPHHDLIDGLWVLAKRGLKLC